MTNELELLKNTITRKKILLKREAKDITTNRTSNKGAFNPTDLSKLNSIHQQTLPIPV
jgi:hypothetical protein